MYLLFFYIYIYISRLTQKSEGLEKATHFYRSRTFWNAMKYICASVFFEIMPKLQFGGP